jgi:hypothetical protein
MGDVTAGKAQVVVKAINGEETGRGEERRVGAAVGAVRVVTQSGEVPEVGVSVASREDEAGLVGIDGIVTYKRRENLEDVGRIGEPDEQPLLCQVLHHPVVLGSRSAHEDTRPIHDAKETGAAADALDRGEVGPSCSLGVGSRPGERGGRVRAGTGD